MQKVKDALLLVRKDRKFKVIAVLVAVAGAFLLLGESPRHYGPPRDMQAETSSPTLATREASEDLIKVFRSELQGTSQTIKQQGEKLEQITQNVRDLEDQTANIFRRILEKVQDLDVRTNQTNIAPAPITEEEPAAFAGAEDSGKDDNDLGEMFEKTPVVAPPPQPAESKTAIIGAGDSVRVKLLAGVNAPTDGTPYPVVFKLVSDVYGPDGSALPLGEARLIAAAQGSLTDQRALFRLTKLNLRLPNGQRKVFPVDGWVVGEDGIRGMSGVLIDPIGKVIAGESFAATIGAAGEGIAANNTRTVVTGQGSSYSFIDGNVGEYAAGRGVAGGARAWEQIIRERYEDMVPVVQVLSGRESTAVFSGSFEVPDLYEALDDEGDNLQYARLD